MKRLWRVAAPIAVVVLSAQALVAQGMPADSAAMPLADSPPVPREGASTPLLIAGGVLGGAAGFLGGALAGAGLASCPEEDDICPLGGAIVGAAAGQSLLLPVGVHVANGRRGKLLPAVLASLGIGAAGLAGLYFGNFDAPSAPVILVATPAAQILAAVLIERRTARERTREDVAMIPLHKGVMTSVRDDAAPFLVPGP